MVSFENFVKSMPPSLSELKVTPSFCFPFKIPDDPTATIIYCERIITLLCPFSYLISKTIVQFCGVVSIVIILSNYRYTFSFFPSLVMLESKVYVESRGSVIHDCRLLTI